MKTKQIRYQITKFDGQSDWPWHETVSGFALDIPGARVCLRYAFLDGYVIDDWDTGFRVGWLGKNISMREALREAESRMKEFGEKYHVARAAVLSRWYFA